MSKLNVLIIEDDRDTAQFFNTVLTLVGFECEMVFNAKDALARLAITEPDLVLLDMRLGYEIDGEDILYQIRTNQRFDQTRVIVVTAYPSMAKTITELADLVLMKPVEVEQLRNLVERIGVSRVDQTQKYFRDPVTDLYNQEFYLTQLEHSIHRARRRQEYLFAALAFSLDPDSIQRCKLTPNELNNVLVVIASRMTRYIRPTDFVARLYGETFATLHEDIKNPNDAEIIAIRILEKLSAPYEIGADPITLSFSIGVVPHGREYRQPVELLNHAEKAMEMARNEGGNRYRIWQAT